MGRKSLPPRRFQIVSIKGHPTPEQEGLIQRGVEEFLDRERRARATSLWLRASRSQGRRLGMLDYRDRFSREDAWRLSVRMPFGGREYPGRTGRADTK
ncbi:MAG: hypothetical protein ABR505_00250 [Actinomycetota bacterium]